jgi:putative nucleotidyltransferase with HDIG domain
MKLRGDHDTRSSGLPECTIHRHRRDRSLRAINRSLLTGRETGPTTATLRSVPDLPQEIARLRQRLREARLDTVMALVAAVEAKDPHTERHSIHVALYAGCLARELHASPRETEVIKVAAVMHDIGKIGVPDALLTKPGPLTIEEFNVIKRHPATGAAILRSATCLRRELPLVLHHHERYDGGGYPAGLKGEEIPFGSRLLHVADSIDAMHLPRSYKRGYRLDEVISELELGRGTQFDPMMTDVAIRWLTSHPDQLITDA